MKRFLPPAIALVIGLVLGALLFRGSPDEHDHSSRSPESADAAAEIWTCSMHPQVQAPKPGKCPICSMDLIPLSALGAMGEGRAYSMSESAKVLAGINTARVERRFPEAEIRLYGTVHYDETQQKTIAARFPGRIERLFVDYHGIPVKKGDHLATIYSPELLAAQTELLTAKRFNNSDALRIARDKLRLWNISDQRIDQIESSGKTSDQLMIDAPLTGIVTEKDVQEGDYVQTGSSLFRINNLDELWVLFDAYESDKPWLRFGQEIKFTAEAIPGRVFDGRISFVSPDLDPKTRTFDIRLNVKNPDKVLKPGMFVRGVVTSRVAGAGRVIDPSLAGKWISPMHPEVIKDGPGKCDVCGMDLVPAETLGYSVVEPDGKGPLVIPTSAVLNTGKRSVVYVEKPDEKEPTFEGREILIGPRAGEFYLVEAGLKEGERVVTEGAFVIDSALQIQARPSMMLPGDESAPLFRQFETGEKFLTAVDGVLRNYFSLQLALAGDDLEEANRAAKSLSSALDGPSLAIKGEAGEVYHGLNDRMRSSLKDLLATEDLKAARVSFEPLSEAIDELVRRFGTEKLPVYVAHCPMAFSGRGADWLQGDEELLNPYFGDAMLRCGEIKEQIAGEVVVQSAAPENAKDPHAEHKK